MNCCECGIDIGPLTTGTRFMLENATSPLESIPRHLVRNEEGEWVFDTTVHDLSRPVCAKCAGIYKESYLDRTLKRAFKQLDEVGKK